MGRQREGGGWGLGGKKWGRGGRGVILEEVSENPIFFFKKKSLINFGFASFGVIAENSKLEIFGF